MKTATPLTAALALMALTACGEDAATKAEADAPRETAVETARAPTPAAEPDAAASDTSAQAKTAPAPEPATPVIAFKGEDGALALDREALTMISPVHDASTDAWSVFVQIGGTAAEDFYDLTARTAGEALSVVIDGMTVSTPTLETAVYGGGFVFPVEDGAAANRVVAALKGEPAPLAIVEIDAEDALPGEEPPAQDTAAADAPDEDG